MENNKKENISFTILTINDLEGTWFIEIQPIKPSELWNNRHWAPESIYIAPEQIELFTREIYKAKENFSFFNENRMYLNEEKSFILELGNTLDSISKMNDKEFQQWINDNKYSKGISKSEKFMKTIQGSIIFFIKQIIDFIEERIRKKEDIMIIGV